MELRQKLQQAIARCGQFKFRRYFIQTIQQRLGVLENEYHSAYEENKNKDYSEVTKTLQKVIDTLVLLLNSPKFDQYGKNLKYWDSYRILSEQFNEFVIRLQHCGFVYTCGVDKGILDLLMVPETGVSKQIFHKIDAMHDQLGEIFHRGGLLKELHSELALLFWYIEIDTSSNGNFSKGNFQIDLKEMDISLSFERFQECMDSFSRKLEGLRFSKESLAKLTQEKSVCNAVQKILSKYKSGEVGAEYVETVMNLVFPNPCLKYFIFEREKQDMTASIFGQESVAIPYAEPLLLQIVECPMDLSNVKLNEIIKITPKTITLGDRPEQPLFQAGVVYFGRQTNKNQSIQNDVSFPSQVNRVSRQQFQIVCKSMNYYSLICTSPSNPTYMKVEQQPYELQPEMIFKIGEYKFLITNLKNGDTQNMNHLPLNISLDLNQQLIRLNINPECETGIFSPIKNNIQEIDLLDKSQFQREISPSFQDESAYSKAIESTIRVKSKSCFQFEAECKPFIEFKCILGDYEQTSGGECKTFRQEVGDQQTVVITFGRDQRNKFVFSEKDISRFHCQIVYDKQRKWKICERYIPDQKSISSGGTFIQLQNFQQTKNEQYSNPCPLQKGMLIHSEGTTFKVI